MLIFDVKKLSVGIIGGGAAGFFAAIHAAQGGARVVLLEKTSKVLSKVKISGGGRCNSSCGFCCSLLDASCASAVPGFGWVVFSRM